MESAPSAPVPPAPEPPGPISAPVRMDAGSKSGSSPGRSAGSTPDAAAAATAPSRGCNDELMAELVHLRREITQLHSSIDALTAAITSLATRPPAACLEPAAELPPAMAPALASPATLLALRSGERLNGEVQRRLRLGSDADNDTELDLLIDRLHDLSDAGS